MKQFLYLLSVAVIASPLNFANAADLDIAQHDWTGFYVGGHVGYGAADANGTYDTDNSPPLDFIADDDGAFKFDMNGINGGLQAGYNWQVDNLVFGFEADASFVNWNDSVGPNGDDEFVSIETDWLATLRLRTGYAVDNMLLYATAGAAFTDTKFFASDNFPTNSDAGNKSLNGLGIALGGGLEYAFDPNWSLKAEALYVLFNDKEGIEGVTSDTDSSDFIKLDDAVIARVGINYHF
jgi:outer membrane immunogenic protein